MNPGDKIRVNPDVNCTVGHPGEFVVLDNKIGTISGVLLAGVYVKFDDRPETWYLAYSEISLLQRSFRLSLNNRPI